MNNEFKRGPGITSLYGSLSDESKEEIMEFIRKNFQLQNKCSSTSVMNYIQEKHGEDYVPARAKVQTIIEKVKTAMSIEGGFEPVETKQKAPAQLASVDDIIKHKLIEIEPTDKPIEDGDAAMRNTYNVAAQIIQKSWQTFNDLGVIDFDVLRKLSAATKEITSFRNEITNLGNSVETGRIDNLTLEDQEKLRAILLPTVEFDNKGNLLGDKDG